MKRNQYSVRLLPDDCGGHFVIRYVDSTGVSTEFVLATVIDWSTRRVFCQTPYHLNDGRYWDLCEMLFKPGEPGRHIGRDPSSRKKTKPTALNEAIAKVAAEFIRDDDGKVYVEVIRR